MYKNKKYKDGLLYKQMNVKALKLQNIQATHEEVKLFTSVKSEEDGNELFSAENIIASINENSSH